MTNNAHAKLQVNIFDSVWDIWMYVFARKTLTKIFKVQMGEIIHVNANQSYGS